ncbi:MAG: cyclic pyranopterin monophosphate synthase MoaC [Desulfobacteraceae bacterium]|jgi:cyclic pyranopterin phosphate synthase
MENLTHLDREGRVRMVDVTAKPKTDRSALAQGWVTMAPATLQMIRQQGLKKGNVLETARIAGILAAKKTADLIPMCHPLNITHCQIDFFPDEPGSRIRIAASVRIAGQTGVEMEALTAVALAALTIYDMCKAVDREMTISDICVLKKSGGKSGDFERDGNG